jgi:Transposase DDE domain
MRDTAGHRRHRRPGRRMTATCPIAVTVAICVRSRQARFGRRCDGCPLRERCTRAVDRKILTVHDHHELLVAARAHAATDTFADRYRQHRRMVERTLAWLVRGGHRKV